MVRSASTEVDMKDLKLTNSAMVGSRGVGSLARYGLEIVRLGLDMKETAGIYILGVDKQQHAFGGAYNNIMRWLNLRKRNVSRFGIGGGNISA